LRIKKLELVGFKSFKDRTVIHFDAGITGVVGPNGCGKSNIVDALVWVMGEMSAKHLRGSSMEDVIFAGSDGYAPMGMAEVSLTLENDGGPFPVQYLKNSEIMITRRLHRGGESEYLINKEVARLKDIQEVFMDTGAGSKGFSIIEQGAIGRIITAKPEERRVLIEEAAGITKFKVRKRESQRKLQSTEQNLLRLHDIVIELKRQIDSLQRQAQKAERYRTVKNEIEDLDLWVSSRHYIELTSRIRDFEEKLGTAEMSEAQATTELASLESDLEAKRSEVAIAESLVSDLQNRQFEVRSLSQRQESKVQELKFEIEQARRNKEMTGSLLHENLTRKELLSADLTRISESLSMIKGQVETLKADYQIKREIFETAQVRSLEIDDELTSQRRELMTVNQGEAHLSAKLAATQEGLENHEERLTDSRSVMQELSEKKLEFETRRTKVFSSLEKERQMQLDLAQDADSISQNKQVLQKQISDKRSEVEQFKDSLNEVASRLYGLENLALNFEGFQEGVKQIMFWQKEKLEALPEGQRENAQEFRPMAEVVEVPSEYELAMEAALGPRLQMLLSQDSSSALGAVNFLKEKKAGRSSFMASDFSGQVVESARIPQKKLLKQVVRAHENFKPMVEKLLDRVAIVDSLTEALETRAEFPNWTFVTTEGDLLTPDGVLTGGTSESADSGVLKRGREIKELTQKKDEWSGKLALAQASLKKAEATLEQVTSEFENAQKLKVEKEILLAEIKKDLERAEQELTNVTTAIQRQEREIMQFEGVLQQKQSELTDLESRLVTLKERRESLEETSQELNIEHLSLQNTLGPMQTQVTEMQIKLATQTQECEGLEKQNSILSKSLAEVESLLSRMTEESSKSTESMSIHQVELEEKKIEFENLLRDIEAIESQLSKAKNNFEEVSHLSRSFEKSLSGLQHSRNSMQNELSALKLGLEQNRMKENYLSDQIRERYVLELSQISHRYTDREGDIESAEKSIHEMREKLSRMGDVNLSAIQEYDDVAKRYEFLSQQESDLIEAKEQLKKVIDKINKICSKRFKDTFEQVNERFTKVFPVLFGGGEARLILVEDHEKGEMGIDIEAKPPGKKLQNVSLLSGGEKALTAVSLIFSIFLVKPSPYCLLDEVDAPLDDANVSRFNDLVREMSKRSQIIVVTHNKYTMEVAKKLFGVTMEEKGVSKMVSVNLDQAQVAVSI
jgi:chromosome segregation protein